MKITVQLSKKNTRFQYKLLKKGGRASEFENAIEWLCLSGIVSRVYKVAQIRKPLENYRDMDAFKIYVSDTGLLCAKKNLVADDILYMVEELNDFKGEMAENYVNMQTYRPDYAIKLSARNFGFENGVKTVPLYAAFCI